MLRKVDCPMLGLEGSSTVIEDEPVPETKIVSGEVDASLIISKNASL